MLLTLRTDLTVLGFFSRQPISQ
eukprot:COSAG01_NODE_72204_length_253_cov_1.344156_1_plen_22_part_10